ncbi:MAG TPA: DUF4129 domain-containing protein, partial [Lacipirellulaceae bacterium]|nr:DUF4129 domain-containing protein [Lacipirellulaceae bacterium]
LKQFFLPGKGAHTPGLWVLYFSLAALPLFGIGQHWIPVTEVGRRRYVFGLLLVYVAAALSLLVTTSFLNLRRYLRQRRVEMPLPIAGTWVGVGAVLIVIVMMLALLIPRPGAEVAVSRVPWQVGSPGGLTASRTSVKRDGGEERADQDGAQGGEREAKEEQGDLPPTKDATSNQSKSAESSKKGSQASEKGRPNSATKESSKGDQNDQAADRSDRSTQNNETRNNKPTDSGKSTQASNADQANKKSPSKIANGETRANENKSSPDKNSAKKSEKRVSTQSLSRPVEAIRSLSSSVGGLVGVLKIVFYVAAALFVGVCVWKYRRQIMAALADILRQLRELFGGRSGAQEADPSEASKSSTRTASFRDFRDPFLAGQNSQMSPEELVRYTFAAFEAWANDRGRPRTPDCTPQELIRMAVEPQTPLYDAARRMVRMYGEVAYASRRVSREAANELREVWQLMRSENPGEVMTGGRM